MENPTPARRIRRRWKVLAGLVALALLTAAALPWLLSAGPGRSRIEAGVNRAFAPGRVEFESIELGWFSPTRLNKVQLLDPAGKVVGRVPVAVLDRTLASLILSPHGTMVLSLDSASLDVERSASGTIDLAEALQTVIANPDPLRDLTIRIDRGTLSYRDPFLAEPSTASRVDLVLRIPTAPNPVNWSLKLAKEGSNLEIIGDFDRWLSRGGTSAAPELRFEVSGKQWPLVAKVLEIDAQGKLTGSLDFVRKESRWGLSGDARLLGLKATGKPLLGDSLDFDKIEAGWDLQQGDGGWTVRRLALNGPLGEVKSEGRVEGANGTGKQKIEGQVDLAAIARQLPHALRLREGLTVEKGSAKLAVDLAWNDEESTFDIEARVSDLAARDHDRVLTLREPVKLVGRFARKGSESSVEQIALETSFLQASARGRLREGVAISGKLDLDAFRRQLGEWVDLGGLELAGKVDLVGKYSVEPSGTVEEVFEGLGHFPETSTKATTRTLAAPRFSQSLGARVSDLRLDGLGFGPIRRDSLKLELTASGPVDDSGFPIDWKTLAIRSEQDLSFAGIRFESGSDSIAVNGSLRMAVIDRVRRARLEFSGDWSPRSRVLTLDEFDCGIAPARREPIDPARTIHARARMDLESGELMLEAAPGKVADALAIAPGGLRISGLGKGLEAIRAEGKLVGDARALDQLAAEISGRSPLGLTGRWSAQATARGDRDGLQLVAKLGLADASDASGQPARPTSLAVDAHYSPRVDRLDVANFAVATPYGSLDASGRLEQPFGARKVELNGQLSPDFAAITALLNEKVEKAAKIDGRPRSFHATGTLADEAGGWKGLDAEFGFDLLGADIYGMKFGPTPVVLRAKNGRLAFDPISTSINEGHIRLEPEIDLDATGGPTLRLAKNSNIREARINDEVSKRVLAFVAPVLDQATRASGLVSVDLDHAEFPIGSGLGRKAVVEGAVVFQDVEFAPGPLAAELLGAIGRRDLSLKLDQPVTLTIADGRINQRGMAIPIADFTRIELSGWVDFDRKIALVATVPVTSAMLGNNPLLSDIAAGTKVSLPIGGTLDKPKVDEEAFKKNLQELGKDLLTRGATRGAMELLFRLARPRDPNAPPPAPRMTPEERKAQRQEKKAIRRGEIPQPDPDGPKD